MSLVAMKCPACGADIELDDSREFGFCSFCGTKVMQDKIVVEHKGNVKIDNSEYVEKFLQNARRAKQKEDWEEVEKYYNLVEQNDPANIEAIFYSSYGKAMLSMVENDIYKRQQICNVFCNSISVIDDNYHVEKSEENQKIISQMHSDLFNMYGTSFVYTQKKNSYGNVVSDNSTETYYIFAKIAFSFIESIENIIKVDDELVYWKMIYEQYKYLARNEGLTVEARNKNRELALSVGNKIHEKDPMFNVDDIEKATKSGCYVATSVYGSYDCPQVWTLRRYRDNRLALTWYGRLFIKSYYAVSPTIVKMFGNTVWFNKMWRGKLDRMVEKLQAEGFESTSYYDK